MKRFHILKMEHSDKLPTFAFMQLTAEAISDMLGGTIEGDPSVVVSQPSKIEEGGKGTITFLSNPKYEQYIYDTTASVVLVEKDFQPVHPVPSTMIRVENVYSAIGVLLNEFNEHRQNGFTGIAEMASIHNTATVGENAYIGEFVVIQEGVCIGENAKIHPQVYIAKGVKIGDNVTLHTGVKIYYDCVIGDNCIIHANTVIGSDGFGFAPQKDGSYKKIAQIGNVVIHEEVEIGSNTTIDRATMGSTVIHKGVKIDNLVQVAHNVKIGDNTVIAAQTGIAGSTKIGKNCRIGGQVGFVGHLKIADGTQIQAQSGIASNVSKENTQLFGTPAIPYNEYIRSYAVFKKLPELYRKIHALERTLNELSISEES